MKNIVWGADGLSEVFEKFKLYFRTTFYIKRHVLNPEKSCFSIELRNISSNQSMINPNFAANLIVPVQSELRCSPESNIRYRLCDAEWQPRAPRRYEVWGYGYL